ncbi:LysR family transcriptional regulator [Zafaria cholistanensis]|uniref:LysR family transcriptional regulator n=1 Tax=Zafaria cholistanensis TaxID=1682741 RepID=A0A5A7NMK3_9MICC|nr:LysR family transcriptional regulator [Zafaria cholistanensis]GER22000.1 LysR family transcriptional regulator [Zafaria cholistanensis]
MYGAESQRWTGEGWTGEDGAAGDRPAGSGPAGGSLDPGFDLNLVRAFVLLHETLSVTRTAEYLGVRQPTVSHSLARLRRLFDDPLFIREGRTLVPTRAARRLYAPLRDALQNVDQALSRTRHFDPETSDANFTVAMSPLGEIRFLPSILELLAVEAPGVRVKSVGLDRETAPEQLLSGSVDAAFGSVELPPAGVSRTPLFRIGYALLADAANPILRGPSVAAFEAARHVVVEGTPGHAVPEAVIERLGIRRRVLVRVGHLAVLPALVRGSDLVAVLAEDIARIFGADFGLGTAALPFEVPPVEVALYCRPDHMATEEQCWFADLIRRAVVLEGTPGRGAGGVRPGSLDPGPAREPRAREP